MITPDLSSKYLPQPKPHKVEKVKVTKIGVGKKVKAWDEARKELKKTFAKWKIIKCEIKLEGCLRDNYLGFAHIKRRVELTNEQIESPQFVVLACQQCHNTVDNEMKKQDSYKLLKKIVEKRKDVMKNVI